MIKYQQHLARNLSPLLNLTLVTFGQSYLRNVTQLQSKNEEIINRKKEIECLQMTKVENQKFHNDIYTKQLEMEECIQQLQNRCKTLERKNSDLLSKITQLDHK